VCGIHCSEEDNWYFGFSLPSDKCNRHNCVCFSDSGAPEIRVYDKNEALAKTVNERILLDTWTISISPDGSVNENSNQENQVTFRKIN